MPLRVAASELLSRFRAARSSRPLLALAVALVALAVAPASALAQFQLGLEDPLLSQATPTTANQEAWGTVHQAAASTVRIQAIWASVAPTGSEPGRSALPRDRSRRRGSRRRRPPCPPATQYSHGAGVGAGARQAGN
jgi:hypothetical protein